MKYEGAITSVSLLVFVFASFFVAYFLPVFFSNLYATNNLTFDVTTVALLINAYALSLVIVVATVVAWFFYDIGIYHFVKEKVTATTIK